MQFTHAGDDGLAGFRVGEVTEGRVVLRRALQGEAEPFLVLPRLGLDGHRHDRVREGRRCHKHRSIFRTQRVTRDYILEPGNHDNVARKGGIERDFLVGLQLRDTADPFTTVRHGIEDRITGMQLSRINAHEDLSAREFVRAELEDERAQRLFVAGDHVNGFTRLGMGTLGGGYVNWARQIGDDRIKDPSC